MVLCQELQVNGKEYPMTGIFPARGGILPAPAGPRLCGGHRGSRKPVPPGRRSPARARVPLFPLRRARRTGADPAPLARRGHVRTGASRQRACGGRPGQPQKPRRAPRPQHFRGVHAPLCSSRPALGRPLRRRLPEKGLIPRGGWRFLKESHATLSPPPPTRFILSATLRFDLRFDAPTPADKTPAIVAPPQKKKESMICSVIFS